jgi:type III pantothenate kinase
MLLAIDVGNTNIVLGVFEADRLVESWRLATLRERTADEIGIWVAQLFQHRAIDLELVHGIVMGSVVPPLTGTLMTMAQRYFAMTPLNVDHTVDTGMTLLYSHPAEIGADRIVNAVAAYRLYGGAGADAGGAAALPLIVVDFGTATTFDAVSGTGDYLGGVICPGVNISAEALFQRAARLPRVDVRKPCNVIGKTTVQAMESGLYYGYVGLVEGLIRRMKVDLGGSAICVATGGLAGVMSAEVDLIEHVDPDLTLQGLRMVWERNRPS